MSDNERPLDTKDANPAVELDDAQLDDVSGALPAVQTPAASNVTTHDIVVTKPTDIASPGLFRG